MSSHWPSVFSPRAWIMGLLIVAAVTWVLAPGVAGDWGRDDYFQLALVRLAGSPAPFFLHDHFPVPGSIFRPLGFASMWLGFAAFGTHYAAHAWSGIALHALVALALHALLRRIRVGEPAALIATLAFALHPAAVGTALWWSARFDVLAALFTLIALRAAIVHREEGRGGPLVLALLAALAATLSKEVGLVAVAALVVQWGHWAVVEPARRRQAMGAVAAAAGIALAYFAWRSAVLGTPASGLTGGLPLGDAIAKGLFDGVRQLPAYLTFWPHLPLAWRCLLVLLLLVGFAVLFAGMRRRRFDAAPVASGITLLLLPLLLQAPVAALNAHPLATTQSVVETAMQSRLYYLGLGGVAILLAVALDRVWNSGTPWRRGAVSIIAAFTGIAIATSSQRDAAAFAGITTRNAALAHAAVAAVDTLELPPAPCHVVFLGVDPPPEWGTYVSMDAIVKALDTNHARSDRCWFHVNYPTWFFTLPTPTRATDAMPYEPLSIEGRGIPWLVVGGATLAYLQAPRTIDATALARMRWLRWDGQRFTDADAEPSAGRSRIGWPVP